MRKALLAGTIIGTLALVGLVGLGLLGVAPAFDLALSFAYPSIYAIGPALSAITPESLDGPPGAVLIILVSAWLELVAITSVAAGIFFWWRSSRIPVQE